ncbi:hypothetical protein CBW65_01510 [Tumebacillus avium]|uniref:AAA+ ATPase domain-containing protein n=1 Tax=Tumebacillus avium TaxID=1903704 RepID=A0A1Y0IHV6_9BACL|nr:AAA family ATPase [Tumebacillus avium]ARU59880.1 hypothetical protein CBW65_01510 [Tumebacillus avium]
MKLMHLKLENYRGFASADLNLNGESAIIIGKNGAGKSTILDAVATAMSPLLENILFNEVTQRPLDEIDIRQHQLLAQIDVEACYQNGSYTWGITRELRAQISMIHEQNLKALGLQIANRVHQNLEDEYYDRQMKENRSIPVVIYYPVHRAVLDIPLRMDEKFSNLAQHTALEDALSVGVNFRAFFGWFRYQEDIENETKIHKDRDFVDPQLQAVREAIETFLPGFRNLRISRVPTERMLIDKDGVTLTVNQLSNGEKILLAMVGDLARRLALANPGLVNPLHGEGIILIDEVELHLHPGWQRKVITCFQQTFPHLQFIFTTHSPQVISEVRNMKLYVLSNDTSGNVIEVRDSVFGQDVNYVLEDVMESDSRNEEIKNRLLQIFRQIEQNQLTEAETGLRDLGEILGSEKPADMIRAEALLRRKRTIGR